MVNEDKEAVSARKAQWYNLAMAVCAEAEGGGGVRTRLSGSSRSSVNERCIIGSTGGERQRERVSGMSGMGSIKQARGAANWAVMTRHPAR